jgi:hypothetical protein
MGQGPKLPLHPALQALQEWRNQEPSVMDSAWEAPLRGLLSIVGAPDDLPLPDPMGMAMAGIPKAVRAKRALVQDEGILGEIKELSKIYSQARAEGNAALVKEAGKRMAELQRIGMGGAPFNPSGSTITSDKLLGPSKTIMNARMKAQLEAAKKGKK